MFKNYLKTSFRSLLKNPLSSFINLFGLAIAIGVCLIVYSFMEFDYTIDDFHENKNEVYLTTFHVDRDGTERHLGLTPTPLGAMLKEDFTHIQKVCRVEDFGAVVKFEDKVFNENIRFVDPEFLEMFTFPLKWGQPSSLKEMNSIIFSEEMSIKYFGKENPLGKNVLLKFGDERKTFTITGVAEPFPLAHAIEFDFLINFENTHTTHPDYDLNNWRGFVNATLIQVEKPSDLKLIEDGMDKYRKLQNSVREDWAISRFEFVKLADLHNRSGDIMSDISQGVEDEARLILPIIGLFMLLLACFNYINIAIVSAAKRLKEIGVRKVIGANRRLVIIQFMAENIFVTLFALFFGLLLGAFVFLPWFNNLFNINLGLRLTDANLWIFLGSILLFTGVASGIYPAFYIAKFEVVRIFKGSVQFGKKNPLTKLFLGFQLILACITITCGVIFTQNTTYQQNRSWGYEPKSTMYARVPDQSAFEKLSAVMIQNPNVQKVMGSRNHLGGSSLLKVVETPERQYEVTELLVEANYAEAMGLELLEGRFFRDRFESDKQAVVANELMIKSMDLQHPVGQFIKIDSMQYEIIGVVKDFHMYSFFNEIRPTMFRVAEKEDYRYMSMKVMPGTEDETFNALKEEWATLFPEEPFNGEHQEDVFGNYFEDIGNHAKFMKAVAFIAVMLAALGLYGLVTLNVTGRVREFSIRKVLGAQLKNIATNITKQYVMLFAISLAIGGPISYFMMEALMDQVYEYHIPMTISGVVIAIVILIFVLLATVSTQVRKVSKANPVIGLKVE
ncbi:MAG: ABC transporter permease [Ekhidna sp.]